MPNDFDWLNLINKRAALREQFPPLSRLILERPGSDSDNRRQRLIAEENQMSKARHDLELWQESVNKNARRVEQLENDKRRRAYKGYQAAKHAEKDIA
ncbi:hypothetical protein ACIP5T_03215 [Microbacterium sp. NPDC088619]|uniref:hypothetical protein n=1 Tax=Microbacterium sp. NPDC088619 TaxID=3364196 RepID=UPI003827B89B